MSDKTNLHSMRRSILRSITRQGFRLSNGQIQLPDLLDKETIRRLNNLAVQSKREKSAQSLSRHEDRLIQYIADGDEIDPGVFEPLLVPVLPDSEEELLFRYVSLHWSIPVSSGYGRRLRFLLMDVSSGKLVGILGLGDPVFSIKARDEWIGWDVETRSQNLYHVMDAFVLGAVPPYSQLLCGKLVALIALSREVREVFKRKYDGKEALISGKVRKPILALLTTTSALGRSSIYNRIHINGTIAWNSLGFTKGTGEFHFANGNYDAIRDYVEQHCVPTAKQEDWGGGFRNRREVVRKCLASLGLPSSLIHHGIHREVFAAPLGIKALAFLRGETKNPSLLTWSVADLGEYFKHRWFLKRAQSRPEFRQFNKNSYRLWP